MRNTIRIAASAALAVGMIAALTPHPALTSATVTITEMAQAPNLLDSVVGIWRIKAFVVLDKSVKAKRGNGHFMFTDKATCESFLEMTPQHPLFIIDTAALAEAAIAEYGDKVELGFACEVDKLPGEQI